ncbi:MAG: hypothetical protein KDD47_03275 [Acidobacteria bacterium]|nr:hypothetical protein [Acidobacteriota bacterium]
MPSLRTISAAYSAALEIGVVGAEEVIAWVDSVIEKTPEPPYPLIEASLAGRDRNLLIRELKEVPGDLDEATRRRLLFGLMHRAFLRDQGLAAAITRHLFMMGVDGDAPDEKAIGVMLSLDDGLDLAQAGVYGTTKEVLLELEAFLSQHGSVPESRSGQAGSIYTTTQV